MTDYYRKVSKMKIRAYRNVEGAIFFDEINNDHDMIDRILEASGENPKLDSMWDGMGPVNDVPQPEHVVDVLWNEYMNAMIEILEDAGCEIVWEDN